MSKTCCLRVCSVLETIRSKPTDMILSHTNQATWTLWTCVIHNLCIFTALYSKMMSGSNGFTHYCIDTNDCFSYDIHLQVICAIFMLIPSHLCTIVSKFLFLSNLLKIFAKFQITSTLGAAEWNDIFLSFICRCNNVQS
jgi:hypothetical protein